MRRAEEKAATRERILSACVRLFIEQGYDKTTLSQIVKEAGVSFSSFQNLFRTKDGVLRELAEIMFEGQFAAARSVETPKVNPVYVYAAETAIQITMTELNESLREVYVAAYTNPSSAEYLYGRTARELQEIFASYLSEADEAEFYELEIGSAGLMRNFMARPCDSYFTLERKLRRFLEMSLRAYRVSEEEILGAVDFVLSLDIKTISNQILQKLFAGLAMRFEFVLE